MVPKFAILQPLTCVGGCFCLGRWYRSLGICVATVFGVCCKSGRNAVSYSSLDVGFVWK